MTFEQLRGQHPTLVLAFEQVYADVAGKQAYPDWSLELPRGLQGLQLATADRWLSQVLARSRRDFEVLVEGGVGENLDALLGRYGTTRWGQAWFCPECDCPMIYRLPQFYVCNHCHWATSKPRQVKRPVYSPPPEWAPTDEVLQCFLCHGVPVVSGGRVRPLPR